MDYVRKTDSNDNNQDSELSKINQKSTIHSLNNKIFVNNSLLSEPVKINVLNGNDITINKNFDNTLFYNHTDDDNKKINSSIKTQCLIFIPLVSLKILIPFLFYNSYLIYSIHPDNQSLEINSNKYYSYTLLSLILLCYILSIKTSSKQMKIEKYIYKRINNSKNQNNEDNTENKGNNENKENKGNNENKENNVNKESENNNNIDNKDNNEDASKKDDNNNAINFYDNSDIANIYNNQVKTFINKDEKLSEKITLFDLKNYNQICNYCHIRSFIRATHCLICDECILFKEEHCPYIANCIGFNNLQYFINLLFWSIYGLTYYIVVCIESFIKFNIKINIFVLIILISDFSINLIILRGLLIKLYKLLYNIYYNITQYELQMEENNLNKKKTHNLFNIGFYNHFYYLIGPTPFHFLFPLPKIKNYGNDENCPIFLKCKFPNRLELVKYLAKKDPKYKEFLNEVESDPYNYIKLCHNYYDDKNIE